MSQKPVSDHVRRLAAKHSDAINFALSIREEFGVWPKYNTVAVRFNITWQIAKTLVEVTKWSESDPKRFQILTSPPALPKRFARRGIEVDPRFLVAPEMVYFLYDSDLNVVKIGFALESSFILRMKNLQSGNVTVLQLLATMPGSQKDERALHRQFHALRVRGEWFRYEEPLIGFIATLPRP